jgi:hypothetical protein
MMDHPEHATLLALPATALALLAVSGPSNIAY